MPTFFPFSNLILLLLHECPMLPPHRPLPRNVPRPGTNPQRPLRNVPRPGTNPRGLLRNVPSPGTNPRRPLRNVPSPGTNPRGLPRNVPSPGTFLGRPLFAPKSCSSCLTKTVKTTGKDRLGFGENNSEATIHRICLFASLLSRR